MSGTLKQLFCLALAAATCAPLHGQTQWVRRSPSGPSSAYLTAVACGGGQFVATGNDGVVLTSVNGTTWARSLSGVSFDLEDVVWSGSRFIVGGDDFDDSIATSSDGIIWSAQAIGRVTSQRWPLPPSASMVYTHDGIRAGIMEA